MRMFTGEYLRSWLLRQSSGLAARTIDSYSDEIERHYIPAFGSVPLDQLTGDHIAAMLQQISSTGHTRAAENAYTVLHKALADAVQDKLLTVSPAISVKRPRHIGKHFAHLANDQLSAYLDVVLSDRLRVAWLLALCCGLRRGEIIGLRWEDVDLSHKQITISNQRQALLHRGVADLPPKSRAGYRIIPLPDDLVSLLLFDWHSSGYVVTGCRGKPFSPSGLDKAHRIMCCRAGLPHITPHGLRTTCGAQAVQSGVHVRVMQQILGHSSYTTTARFYAAVDASSRVAAIDKITENLIKYHQ